VSVPSTAGSSGGSASITVLLCFLVAILEGFDIQILGVAAPRLGPELGIGPSQMGWLFAVGSIGMLLGAAVGGRLADRVGRKPVFVASVAVFGLFTFAITLVTSFESLFMARLLAGVGFGAALPNMMAIATEVSSPSRRAFTAAAMFCGMPLGGAASALVTQMLPPDFDWRTLFYLGGLLPLLLLPAIITLMPETLQRRTGAGVVSDGLRAVTVTHALFGEGRAATTLLLWSMFLPAMLILYLFLNWLPTLVAAKGLERTVAPLASLWFNLGGVFGGLLLSPLVDRFGYRKPVTLAFAALIGVLMGFAAATTPAAILLFSGLSGFLLLGATYSFYGVTAASYSQSMRGTGSGAAVAVGRVGTVIGPLFAGLLIAKGATAESVILYLAPMAAVSGVAVLALGRLHGARPR
jgi:AAHS family 3-hydroxyphenylpropionic acid transporter